MPLRSSDLVARWSQKRVSLLEGILWLLCGWSGWQQGDQLEADWVKDSGSLDWVGVVELQERGWFGKCNVCLLYCLRIRNSAIKDKKNK